jgi:hypothetical protein
MNGYNFTERVRKVLAMAREEAARLHHEYVGTEHMLLGLIREGEGVAGAVLRNLRVDFDKIQQKIEETVKIGTAEASTGPDLPWTSRAKKVLELAMGEARDLSHGYVGTEHLLLGLLREEKGIAAQVLTDAGVSLDAAKAETLRLLSTEMPQDRTTAAMQATLGTTQTQTGKNEEPAWRVGEWLYQKSGYRKLLFWWGMGILFEIAFATGVGPPTGSNSAGVGAFLGLGALLGLFVAAPLFWAVNQYRTERRWTWTRLGFQATLLFGAFYFLGKLQSMNQETWNRVTPILIVIGFYAAYVGGGLLVLYLAVRVVRTAWYRGQTLE